MIRRVLLAAVLLALTGWQGSAWAADSAKNCSPRTAVATTIVAIQADYPAWSGRCVSLQGVDAGEKLFADRKFLLEEPGLYSENALHSIVLYAMRKSASGHPPRWVEVTGVVGSCADHYAAVAAMQAEYPDEIIMVSGYCHTSMATYVKPVAISRLSSRRVVRLTEAEVPVERRALVVVPPGFPGAADHAAAARALAAAMATGDRAAYLRLTRPDVQHELDRQEAEVPDWVGRKRREASAEFVRKAELRRDFAVAYPFDEGQERLFAFRRDMLAVDAELEQSLPTMISCWCRTRDCTGRWPVAAFDADNDPARPYLCVETHDYSLGPWDGRTIQADVPFRRKGFAEPAWPETAPVLPSSNRPLTFAR